MDFYSTFIIFLFGLVVGSFLNVVIYWIESERKEKREKRKERNDIFGRSFCTSCGHQLGFLDLFPVFSWMFLKGKCRYCKEKISVQYPMVELLTGAIFVLTFYFSPIILSPVSLHLSSLFLPSTGYWLLATIFLLILNSLLITLFVYDLKHKIIPDKIIYPTIILATVYLLLSTVLTTFSFLLPPVLAALGAGGFFYLIAAISDGKWMGGGDIKLAFLMGLLLGWPNILVGLGLGFVLGAVVGVALLVLNKAERNSEIPFGPFLITGTWIALFFGEEVVQWYMKAVGF